MSNFIINGRAIAAYSLQQALSISKSFDKL